MAAMLESLKNMTPWGTPEQADLPTMDPQKASEAVRFKWKRIDPKVDMATLPPLLQALYAAAMIVSDMSVKVLLTTKQAVSGDLGRKWAEEGFFKTREGADVAQNWATGGQTAALVCQFVLPSMVGYLEPMQAKARDMRGHMRALPNAWAHQKLRDLLGMIPDFGNGKLQSDLRQGARNIAPGVSNFTMQQGQIATTKAGADNQYSQFNTQKADSEKQQASQFKSDLQQQIQAWQQFAMGLIEEQHRVLEKIASAA